MATAKENRIDTLLINDILFAFSSYKITNPDTLERFRGILGHPGIKRIKLIGFTDDMGTEAFNEDLSRKRALEIARLLFIKFGIPKSIIEAEGQGISTEYADQKQNRRVEIYIYH